MVAVAQLLAAGFLLDQATSVGWRFLLDRELWLIVGGTALMLAGGYLLNAFYDLEKDMANHPSKVIMGRVIRPSQALQAWLALSLLTILVIWPLGFRFLAYYAFYGLGLWLYSHKLKRIPLLGNAASILLLLAAFMALVLYYRDANIPTLVFVFYVGVLEWIRGLIKDCQNVRGDAIYGYRTVPVVLGLRKTRNLLLLSPIGSYRPSFGYRCTAAFIPSFLTSWSPNWSWFLGLWACCSTPWQPNVCIRLSDSSKSFCSARSPALCYGKGPGTNEGESASGSIRQITQHLVKRFDCDLVLINHLHG